MRQCAAWAIMLWDFEWCQVQVTVLLHACRWVNKSPHPHPHWHQTVDIKPSIGAFYTSSIRVHKRSFFSDRLAESSPAHESLKSRSQMAYHYMNEHMVVS